MAGLLNSIKRFIGLFFHPEVQLHRTIEVDAPIEVVYDFWKDFGNYARFMSYVKEVKVNDRFGITWTVIGPRGMAIHWDVRPSSMIRNQRISWESLPGALIENAGRIFFSTSKNSNQTLVDVNLSYAPPAGILGYQVIKVLGFDPRDQIDHDLTHMRYLIEQDYKGLLKTNLR
jgi:uncharacterized membrane protein